MQDMRWVVWAMIAVLLLIVLAIVGCTHWEYDRQTTADSKTVHVGRSTLFMWGRADYVEVIADPNGAKSLTIGDLLLDPEKVSVTTPYGVLGGGD